MLHTKLVTIPETTQEIITHKTCDFCDNKIIEENHFNYNEVTITQKSMMVADLEWGYSDTIIFDCCSDCWNAKIFPVLKTLGTPRTEHIEH